MQLPLVFCCDMAEYLQFLKNPSLKFWSEPCPLCGAECCAKCLGVYVRRRVYCPGVVSEDVAIARFVCRRPNRDEPAGTHRTFSLLPIFLIPYVRYSLDLTMAIAEELANHADNVYRATGALIDTYEGPISK
jgi:hypothetical protein